MNSGDILIHYEPGARGDFLASILKNKFIHTGTKVHIIPPYTKVHHVRDPIPDGWGLCINNFEPIKNFNGTTIRIDPELDAFNLVEIQVNHLMKNYTNVDTKSIDSIWQIYNAIIGYLNLDYPTSIQHKELYTYWVPYKKLFDLEFLCEMYHKFNGEGIPSELLNVVNENLSCQFNIRADKDFYTLSKLIQFEIDNNLFNIPKHRVPFYNLNTMDQFLTKDNYIMENFQ